MKNKDDLNQNFASVELMLGCMMQKDLANFLGLPAAEESLLIRW